MNVEELVSALTLEEKAGLCSGADFWHTKAVERLGIPAIKVSDGPHGLRTQKEGSTDPNDAIEAVCFPAGCAAAASFDPALTRRMGAALGREARASGVQVLLGPAVNIKRSPLCGRNFEYYSEDPFLSGTVASKEVYGAATKGLYAYIKHFAFNDQENHRGDRDGQYGAATWLNEQSAREIYLKPFEMCMKLDDVTLNYVEKQADGSYKNATTTIPAALGVMTAFNRVGATWTGGSYALITGILRTEWGFNGAVITDNANTGVFMGGQQMIEAGGDMKLTYVKNSARWDDFDKDNAETYHYAREALHHVLYTTANTKAMNGAMPGSIYKDGPQVSTTVRTVVNILCTLLLILLAYRVFRVWKPSKRKLAKMEAKAAKKAAKKANT